MNNRQRKQELLGQIYYFGEVDSQGYPNGMPRWGELPAEHQYRYCALACDFLDRAVAQGFLSSEEKYALKDSWGEGDCKALYDHLEEKKRKGEQNKSEHK